ncbi:phosphatidylglycerophosphatase A family protein [Colwellia sp. MEBiC06753]
MTKVPAHKLFKLANPIHFLAVGFGSGLAPKAPGTFGTLAAIPVFWLMATYLSPSTYLWLTLVFTIVGISICGKAAESVGVHDHGAIVWDEIVGYLITMAFVPATLLNIVLGFVLFRIFDIFKPWPISIADKKLGGGFGIMFDDVLAGIASLIIMQIYLAYV